MKSGRPTPIPTPIKAALLAVFLLLAGALPAEASSGLVLAAAKPWHYWIAFVLTASVLGLFAMLGLGYVVRVTMQKYGIKIGHRSGG